VNILKAQKKPIQRKPIRDYVYDTNKGLRDWVPLMGEFLLPAKRTQLQGLSRLKRQAKAAI
jgi:hypothetical protein